MRAVEEVKLGRAEFERLARFVYEDYGINLTQGKHTMVETRLRKRLSLLGLKSFREYTDLVLNSSDNSDEIVHMIDAITTNKTDFFREPAHYEVLVKKVLPDLMVALGAGLHRPLVLWSAGCSTGEEPYTLAMVINEFRRQIPGMDYDFRILATDISTRVLAVAERAVYPESRIEVVPQEMKKKYLLKSRDTSRRLVRISPELRQQVRFRRLNLMNYELGFREKLDIIFCRNVIIYFDRSTQQKLLQGFCERMQPGGYLFLGHSESTNGLDLAFETVAPTVYRKPMAGD